MQPEFPDRLAPGLPRPMKHLRDLEEFEGPILSEFQAEHGGGLYLWKWCARQGTVERFLVVRTEQRAVARYLARRLSLLHLLCEPSDGIGFIVDQEGGEVRAAYLVKLTDLPPRYLPKATAMHDEALRPAWEFVPQSFLLDANWNARLLADLERRYLSVASFSYLTEPGAERQLPGGVLAYEYNRGYPIANAFARMRAVVPPKQRARSAGVSANSPGVLTLAAPAAVAGRVAAALQSTPGSLPAYRALTAWSRIPPSELGERMPPMDQARAELDRLCSALGVARAVLLPEAHATDPLAMLIAGKLLAAYFRQLSRLLRSDHAEFISVHVEWPPSEAGQPLLPFLDDDADE